MRMNTNAFARAIAMMAQVQAAMAYTNLALREAALADIGPYVSRGKGSSKNSPSRHRVAMDKRAARKARNVKRARAARRG